MEDLAIADLRTTEFVAVDTETNGRSGDACEMTEVGAVLVGGGELHDRFSTLVAIDGRLPRSIERFTGITAAMLAEAPPPEEVLPRLAELMRGRVLVAHSASFDRRVLAQAFERAGLEWPDPPLLCTVTMARRFAPLAGERKLAPLARHLGIDVDVTHRALPDAELCGRVFCSLFPKLLAHAPTVADAVAMLGPRRGRRVRPERAPVARRAPAERPAALRDLPDEVGVYIFRDVDGRPLYVGKSVSLRTRARSHFTAAPGWTGSAEQVDHTATSSELGALVLENRLIKRWSPPGNAALKRMDRWVFLRCRLDIEYPILEVSPEPAPGRGVTIGPVRGRHALVELAEQVTSLFGLRHCGRVLHRRQHPSAYGQMGRCLSPCLGDLDPNLYRRRLDEALELLATEDGGAALLAHVEGQMRAAARELAFERAAWLRRRHGRLRSLLERLDGVLRATHARPRLVLAPHPRDAGRFDAFWLVGGRVADWGAVAGIDELEARTAVAAARVAGPPGWPVIPRDEVDEVRIVAAWLARNPDVPELALDPAPGRGDLEALLARAGAGEDQASPTYQVPDISATSPKAGISTVR